MRIVIALASLLGAEAVCASSTIQSLKDEQASLFDLGMFRLELHVSHSHESVHTIYSKNAEIDPISSWVSTTYSSRDKMIRVATGFMDNESSPDQMEAGCRAVLRMLRISVSKTTWRFFSHYGEEDARSVQGPDLYDQIVLRCYVSREDSSQGRFWATMPLKGNLGEDDGFQIGRWRVDNE